MYCGAPSLCSAEAWNRAHNRLGRSLAGEFRDGGGGSGVGRALGMAETGEERVQRCVPHQTEGQRGSFLPGKPQAADWLLTQAAPHHQK
jgi:hypothetical protein